MGPKPLKKRSKVEKTPPEKPTNYRTELEESTAGVTGLTGVTGVTGLTGLWSCAGVTGLPHCARRCRGAVGEAPPNIWAVEREAHDAMHFPYWSLR